MTYTLITPIGRIYQFYILGCAELYQQAFGGCIIDNRIIAEEALDKNKSTVV